MTTETKQTETIEAQIVVQVNEQPASEKLQYDYVGDRKAFRDKTIFLDVSCKTIRFACISFQKKKLKTHLVGELPGCSTSKGSLKSSIEKLLESLSFKFNIQNSKIVVIIPGDKFFIRSITVPVLKNEELEKAVRWECSKLVPFDINDAYLKRLNVHKVDNKLNIQVGLVARAAIDRFAFLGNKLKGVIPSPLALAGMMLPESNQAEGTNVVIQWGMLYASTIFISNGEIRFCGSTKLESGLSEEDDIFNTSATEKIENSLKNNFDFYYSLYPSEKVSGIRLYGPDWQELAERLASSTDFKCSCPDPYEHLIGLRRISSELWNATGFDYVLPISAGIASDEFFYLPEKVLASKEIHFLKKLSLQFTVGAAAFLLIAGLISAYEYINLEKQTVLLNDQIRALENSSTYHTALQLQSTKAAMAAISANLAQSDKWLESKLRVFSHAVEPGITLTSLKLTRDPVNPSIASIALEGFYDGQLEKADYRVARFIEKLEFYTGFTQERLDRFSDRVAGDNKSFSVVLEGTAAVN